MHGGVLIGFLDTWNEETSDDGENENSEPADDENGDKEDGDTLVEWMHRCMRITKSILQSLRIDDEIRDQRRRK